MPPKLNYSGPGADNIFMDPDTQVVVMAMMGIALVVGLAVMIAVHIPYMLKDKSRFNSTAEWIPAPEYEQKTPTGVCLTPYDQRLITSYLEPDETVEGFTRGFFVPHRPSDWRFGSGIEKLPLLIAATSRRMLLFEVRVLTVYRYCFIPYDEIEYMQPPKPGILGTSGRMKFGLKSGHEYQMGFLGPLFSDEGMRQEQSMAAYFRWIAPRFRSSPTPSDPRRAAA